MNLILAIVVFLSFSVSVFGDSGGPYVFVSDLQEGEGLDTLGLGDQGGRPLLFYLENVAVICRDDRQGR